MERDNLRNVTTKAFVNFNSHAHVERDMFTGLYARQIYDFNSHAHVERDPCIDVPACLPG